MGSAMGCFPAGKEFVYRKTMVGGNFPEGDLGVDTESSFTGHVFAGLVNAWRLSVTYPKRACEALVRDTDYTSSDEFAKHRDYYGRPLRTVSATGSFEALLEINGSSEGLLRE